MCEPGCLHEALCVCQELWPHVQSGDASAGPHGLCQQGDLKADPTPHVPPAAPLGQLESGDGGLDQRSPQWIGDLELLYVVFCVSHPWSSRF